VIRIRLALFILLSSFGCSRDRDDVREWRASDHDQETETPSNAAVPVQSAASESPPSSSTTAVAASRTPGPQASWSSLCASCHGRLLPDNRIAEPASGVRDLSDIAWQKSVSDVEIAATIRRGRGRMPAFSLPVETVDSLTKFIRSLRPRN
jgi:cytochrome c oxidase cbb3-type subunit 3